jgi:hypothetical protein
VPGVEERQQRHHAALAMIVGPQDQNGIFEPDDQDEGPEDQRHDPGHRFGRGPAASVDGLLQPVERAVSDIAVNDTACREHRKGGLLFDSLPRDRRALKGLGHPDAPSFGCKYARKAALESERCLNGVLVARSSVFSCPRRPPPWISSATSR